MDDGSSFGSLRNLIASRERGGLGVDPRLVRTLGPERAARFQQGVENIGPQAEAIRKGYMKQPGKYGTGLAAVGVTSLQALGGDPLGAVTSIPGSLAGGGLGSLAANLMPGALKPVAKAVFPLVGGLIGGSATEQAARAGLNYLGAKIPGSEEVAAKSQEERTREFDREQARKDFETKTRAELARDLEYAKAMMPLTVEQEKALMPLREQLMRTQLVNQQALNASNAALYQQMGRSATMGKYVLNSQAEAGATTRTLLTQNPYANSVLQAPQISFG